MNISANDLKGQEIPRDFAAGNSFDKYHSHNPIHRWMMSGFLGCASELVALSNPRSVLEVGCGPGDLALRLFGPADEASRTEYTGIDISAMEVEKARATCPGRSFHQASIYELPFGNKSFDMVVACEVLEHLDHPEAALREIERVSRHHVLVSVPWEPIWRVLNLARGKYVLRLGNTLGHVQHFSRTAIRRAVRSQFEIIAERRPFPWTMLLANSANRLT